VEQALNDGEDFELLLAMDSGRVPKLQVAWKEAFPEVPLSVIGQLVATGNGEELVGGWDHFSASAPAGG
jgi:thiamine monophosphate kinase